MRGTLPRRRLAGAVLVTALATALATTHAAATGATATTAPPRTTLVTLSGNGSSYVDVLLRHSLTVDNWLSGGGQTSQGWSWRGCGAYRGFYLQPLDHPGVGAGAIDFAVLDFAPNPRRALPVGGPRFSSAVIPSGLVRVHLLAAAPCTLSVRLLGDARSLSFRTTQPSAAHVAIADLDLDLAHTAGAPRVGAARWDVPVDDDTLLMTYARSLSRTVQAAQHATTKVTCPATPAGAHLPYQPGVSTAEGDTGAELPNHAVESVTWFLPRKLPAGTCTVTAVAGGPTAVQATGGYVAIDLGGAARTEVSPPCERVLPSPSFAKDHVVACLAGNLIWVSTDAGRLWHRPLARGLPPDAGALPQPIPTAAPGPMELFFSPLFAEDHTLYAHADTGPLLASTDLGETFTVADPTAYQTNGIDFRPFVQTGPTGDHTALTYDDTNHWFIRPDLHSRVPGFNVDNAVGIALPQRFPADGEAAFLLRRNSTAAGKPGLPFTVYACRDELDCAVRADLPVSTSGWDVTGNWLGGRPGRRTVYFALRGQTDGASAWRSTDGGRTFASWTSLTRLLVRDVRRDADRPEYQLAHHPAFPHRVYLRVSRVLRERAARSVPDEAVFRSDDDGTTWRQVAGGWSSARGGAGSVPWMGFPTGGWPGTFELAGDGSLFATGWARGDHRIAVYRSTDGGAHWREAGP
jgi:hypothetical protein